MTASRSFTVAVDGPAAAGKGTVSRALAERFGFAHLDTGMLYRAVGARSLSGEIAAIAARALSPDDLARDDLRTAEVAQAASRVAADPEVRAALLAFQREFARRPGGAVLDGRDIGTVIAPEAEVKLFVTASAEVRAARRRSELAAKGDERSLEEVLADVRMRDERDANRADAPLRRAAGAVLIDTTELSIDEAVERAAREVEKAL